MHSLKSLAASLLIGLATFTGPASAQSDVPLPTPTAKVTVDLKVYALATG
ncbi:hypothetical protein [Polynucleobacter necessarius]|nr:hypothetical protein [Polynucleobacter necessarius]